MQRLSASNRQVTAFTIGDVDVAPGTRQLIELPISVTSDHTPVNLSASVVHGRNPGPVLLVSAAVHGDEIIGVEIARRLVKSPKLRGISGTLITIPIVNQLGFINRSRYLPDRRDLNRSFPGRESGSLAARLAQAFFTTFVSRADLAIDLHSAAIHRTNLPQIRIHEGSRRLAQLADAFAAPVVLTTNPRAGSLRKTALEHGVDLLVYEAGEALRFDDAAIRTGLNGILRVMAALGMISSASIAVARTPSLNASASVWARAPAGGLVRRFRPTGQLVGKDEVLGTIVDPFARHQTPIVAPWSGLIIGRSNLPLVNEGDALYNIARVDGKRARRHGFAAAGEELVDEDQLI